MTAKDHPWRRVHDGDRVQDGDLVAFASGVLDRGYIGEVGRTWPVGDVTAGLAPCSSAPMLCTIG